MSPQRIQQLLMNPPEPAIAHDQDLIAVGRLRGHPRHDGVHAVEDGRPLAQPGEDARRIPPQILRRVDIDEVRIRQ